jgi:hypothetical protein
MSIIKNFIINSGTMNHNILVTAQKTDNDYNGNPQYLVQVWTGIDGHVWYPKLKGYRDRKDNSYKMQSYDIHKTLNHFVNKFENHIKQEVL